MDPTRVYREKLKKLGMWIFSAFLSFIFLVILTGYFIKDWMHQFEQSPIYPGFAATTSFILLSALYFKARNNNLRGIRYLLSFSFFIFTFNFLQILDWSTALMYTPFKRPIGAVLLNVADLCIPFITLSLYLHFSSIEETKNRKISNAIVGLTVFPSIILDVLVIIFRDPAINDALIWVLAILAMGIIYITLFGLQVMTRIYLQSNELSVQSGAIMMIIAIFFMTLAFTTQILTPDTVNFGLFRAEMFQLLIFAMGTSILTYTYVRNPLFIFAIPFKVYELIIHDMEGTTIWSHNFVPSLLEPETESMKTTGLNAIGNILREISGFRGEVKSISLSDGVLILEKFSDLSMVVIADTYSEQIKMSNQLFLREFAENRESSKQIWERILLKYYPFSNSS